MAMNPLAVWAFFSPLPETFQYYSFENSPPETEHVSPLDLTVLTAISFTFLHTNAFFLFVTL